MTIWQFQAKVTRRLLTWAGISILIGIVLQLNPRRFWKNLGMQFASWGFINALIAIFGNAATQDRIAALPNPGQADILQEEGTKLRNILLVNAVLDVFYVIGGWQWVQRDTGEGGQRGHGWGVILQGGFLLFFDVLHAWRVKSGKPEE